MEKVDDLLAFATHRPPQPGPKTWNIPVDQERSGALPPNWVFTIYRDLEPPAVFTMKDLSGRLGSDKARQFAHAASKHRWVVRTGRGEYAALDPSLAIRVSAVSGYWQELLALNEAFRLKDIPYAFACLPTIAHTDLVPERPLLVVRHSDGAAPPDAFVHDFTAPRNERVQILRAQYEVPVTNLEDTSLLLAATNLPREVAAAKQILDSMTVTKRLAKRLNHYGLTSRDDVFESVDPDIRLPRAIEERRQGLAEELLKGSST